MHPVLLRVAFDPLSYIDGARLPPEPVPTAARAAVNRHLLRHYRLAPLPMAGHSPDEREMLALWFALRRATYLLGAYRLRPQLLARAGLVRCDPGLRRFLCRRLPLAPVAVAGPALGAPQLLRAGVPVLAPLAAGLSAPWRARLALMFPPEAAAGLNDTGAGRWCRYLVYQAIEDGKEN